MITTVSRYLGKLNNTVKYQYSDTLYKFGHCRVFF